MAEEIGFIMADLAVYRGRCTGELSALEAACRCQSVEPASTRPRITPSTQSSWRASTGIGSDSSIPDATGWQEQFAKRTLTSVISARTYTSGPRAPRNYKRGVDYGMSLVDPVRLVIDVLETVVYLKPKQCR